jgi:hypothetical protein
MLAAKTVAELRGLRNTIATASSARVLDLHALAIRTPDDPSYAERPMFIHPVLNRSIIVKHNLSSNEVHAFGPKRFNATKVIFPFDTADLGLGGQWLLVSQKNFIDAFSGHLDYTGLSMDRDVAVLKALDRLPTLDPFLVRESLSQQRIDVALCYFRFSPSDEAAMLGFVAEEIEALTQLCFGTGPGNEERTRRLSQLLLANEDSAELEPLRETFRMRAAEFSEAIFSWKAFLYYHWRTRAVAPMVKAALVSIAAIKAARFERDELEFVMRAKRLVETTINRSLREIGQRLKLYDEAFASLTAQGDPETFRAFLVDSPSLFVELGDRIGRLEQVVSFWSTRFGAKGAAGRSPEGVLDGMRDLLQALSLEISAPAAPSPVV